MYLPIIYLSTSVYRTYLSIIYLYLSVSLSSIYLSISSLSIVYPLSTYLHNIYLYRLSLHVSTPSCVWLLYSCIYLYQSISQWIHHLSMYPSLSIHHLFLPSSSISLSIRYLFIYPPLIYYLPIYHLCIYLCTYLAMYILGR